MVTIIIFLIFGLIIGSFLNVLVYRLHESKGIFWGRSSCPHCDSTIRWYDNIPLLSFFLLKFRCRECLRPISWQYPIIELATGITFSFVGLYFFQAQNTFSWSVTGYYLAVFAILIVIFAYDWLYMEIPSIILGAGVLLAVAFNLWADSVSFLSNNSTFSSLGMFEGLTYSGTLAAFLSFIFFFFLVAVSKEKWMGMGDAYLAIFLGLILGWPKIVLAIFLSFFIGSVFGMALIIIKKKKLKSRVPFAPFLILGTIITLFFYNSITQWYFSLFY